MNFKILPTPVMIILAEGWLGDSMIRGAFDAHSYGAASLAHLEKVNIQLALLHQLRKDILSEIERLGEELTSFDGLFARKGRSFHDHLDALAEGEDRPEQAARYRDLKERFFPNALSILQRSYLEKGGMMVEIEKAMTAEIMGELEEVLVGNYTLADLYRSWVAAGTAIGERVQARMRLQASLSREGTAADEASSTQVRSRWIRAVRMLLSVANEIQISDEVREAMLAPLERSIAEALRRRAESSDELPDGDGADDSDAADHDAVAGAVASGEAASVDPASDAAEPDPAGERTMESDATQANAGETQADAGEAQPVATPG